MRKTATSHARQFREIVHQQNVVVTYICLYILCLQCERGEYFDKSNVQLPS